MTVPRSPLGGGQHWHWFVAGLLSVDCEIATIRVYKVHALVGNFGLSKLSLMASGRKGIGIPCVSEYSCQLSPGHSRAARGGVGQVTVTGLDAVDPAFLGITGEIAIKRPVYTDAQAITWQFDGHVAESWLQSLVTDDAYSKLSKSSLFSISAIRNLANFLCVSDRLAHTNLNSKHCHGMHDSTDYMSRIRFQAEVDH
jgi:hypothetical protein